MSFFCPQDPARASHFSQSRGPRLRPVPSAPRVPSGLTCSCPRLVRFCGNQGRFPGRVQSALTGTSVCPPPSAAVRSTALAWPRAPCSRTGQRPRGLVLSWRWCDCVPSVSPLSPVLIGSEWHAEGNGRRKGPPACPLRRRPRVAELGLCRAPRVPVRNIPFSLLPAYRSQCREHLMGRLEHEWQMGLILVPGVSDLSQGHEPCAPCGRSVTRVS